MKLSTILAAAAATAVGFVKADKAEDIVILQYALTLEHLEATFYAEGLAKYNADAFSKAGFPANVRERIVEIGGQEATHVTALSGILTGLGQKPTQQCTYDFGYDSLDGFLATARLLESVGVSAYLGKAPLITDKLYLAAAGAILTVEARHQAIITEYQGADGTPSPFDTALSGSQVFSLAAPLITSCPKGNPTLPFKQFPALPVTGGTIKAGGKIYFGVKHPKGPVYIHFLNGLSDTVVPLNGDGSIIIPSSYTGTVYAIASYSKAPLTDPATIAGPAVLVLETGPKQKRSIAF